jgi:hypothetical protein
MRRMSDFHVPLVAFSRKVAVFEGSGCKSQTCCVEIPKT